MTIHWK